MFVEMKVFKLAVGNSESILNKFSKSGIINTQPGFVDMAVMKKVRKADHEEVVVEIRWESQDAYTAWKRSDAHKAGHGAKKERPDYILDVTMDTYHVETFKTPIK